MTNTNDSRQQTATETAPLAQPPHPGEADLSERDTLRRAAAGDREALDALLAAARPRLYAVALKMVRDHDQAEDVVQDAMLKVWRNVDRFEQRAALSTWLHRIVVNTALDHLRSRRGRVLLTDGERGRDRSYHSGADEPPPPEGASVETPEDMLGRAEVGEVVRSAMSRLGPVQRDVLALRELDGESYQSIAQIARCPVGTVMSRLHHARRRLAETLTVDAADLLPQAA